MPVYMIIYNEDGTTESVSPEEFQERIGKDLIRTRVRKKGYTVAELIEELKKYDPDTQVSVGKSGIYDVESLPYYYDGRLRLAVYEEIEVRHPTNEKHSHKYRSLVGSEQATGGNHVFFNYLGGHGDSIMEDAGFEGILFEYNFKGVRDPAESMNRVWGEIKQGLQCQLDIHGKGVFGEEFITEKRRQIYMDSLRGLKTHAGEWVITKEELTQEYLDSLTAEVFWQLVKDRTSLDLFDQPTEQ